MCPEKGEPYAKFLSSRTVVALQDVRWKKVNKRNTGKFIIMAVSIAEAVSMLLESHESFFMGSMSLYKSQMVRHN